MHRGNCLPPGRQILSHDEYSLDGRLLTVGNSQGDGSESVLTYAYDGAGRSLSITSNLNSDRTDFRYDEHGGMTKILSLDPKTVERNRNAATTGSVWDAALFGMGVSHGWDRDRPPRPEESPGRGASP